MFDSLAASSEYARVGSISPTAHYDPSALLVNAEYDTAGAAVLFTATLALVLLAAFRFRRVDLAS
ncbi:hypothetical protein [Halorubrum lacusprofundi]|jgi:ABC-2 type transport system permease protein|uniref:Uncharacterized protein n=1 Tax=Halorubrum lacusprofundi (strain ATCC 49239 / DSM 5036 / JCM 8891 / ACAM 34) TaxID=416348 RepID=B9LUU6_HALLT|nr:hypothetical protein [Halorubrum lacusprofundi]ACM56423.1 hypothetical protein Hlac_0824 [Halorubrum lacusprofundi ATCC 49239]MCG1005304.1 hypothetical protein [Halorubrum lacusprofundi]